MTWTLSRDVIPVYGSGSGLAGYGYGTSIALTAPSYAWGSTGRWLTLPRQATGISSVTFKAWDAGQDQVLTEGPELPAPTPRRPMPAFA